MSRRPTRLLNQAELDRSYLKAAIATARCQACGKPADRFFPPAEGELSAGQVASLGYDFPRLQEAIQHGTPLCLPCRKAQRGTTTLATISIYQQLGHDPRPGYSYIYQIIRRADFRTVYIGATNNPYKRCQNYHEATVGEGPVSFAILQEVHNEARHRAEQLWIRLFREAGSPLKNKAKGGHGSTGSRQAESVKEFLRALKIGKPNLLSEEGRKRLQAAGAAHKGKAFTEPHKQKLREAATGRRHTEEARARMRLAWDRRRKQVAGLS